MMLAVLVALAALGSATWFVLNRATSRNPHTNALASRILLGTSGFFIVAGLIAGLAGLLRS